MQREKEQREREERQKAEERRQEQLSMAKVAPWSQANSSFGMSLADIQKAEKERKAQEAVLQAQRTQMVSVNPGNPENLSSETFIDNNNLNIFLRD